MNVRRNAVAHLTALSLSRVLGQLASWLDAPRMTRALRLFSQGTPAMPRPTLAPSILRDSAPSRMRLVPSLTSLGRQEPVGAHIGAQSNGINQSSSLG